MICICALVYSANSVPCRHLFHADVLGYEITNSATSDLLSDLAGFTYPWSMEGLQFTLPGMPAGYEAANAALWKGVVGASCGMLWFQGSFWSHPCRDGIYWVHCGCFKQRHFEHWFHIGILLKLPAGFNFRFAWYYTEINQSVWVDMFSRHCNPQVVDCHRYSGFQFGTLPIQQVPSQPQACAPGCLCTANADRSVGPRDRTSCCGST